MSLSPVLALGFGFRVEVADVGVGAPAGAAEVAVAAGPAGELVELVPCESLGEGLSELLEAVGVVVEVPPVGG